MARMNWSKNLINRQMDGVEKERLHKLENGRKDKLNTEKEKKAIQEKIIFALHHEKRVWETKFLKNVLSLITNKRGLSEKQSVILSRIYREAKISSSETEAILTEHARHR